MSIVDVSDCKEFEIMFDEAVKGVDITVYLLIPKESPSHKLTFEDGQPVIYKGGHFKSIGFIVDDFLKRKILGIKGLFTQKEPNGELE